MVFIEGHLGEGSSKGFTCSLVPSTGYKPFFSHQFSPNSSWAFPDQISGNELYFISKPLIDVNFSYVKKKIIILSGEGARDCGACSCR